MTRQKKCASIYSDFLEGGFKMFEMLSKDINSYSNEVRKYVDGILLAALTAEVDLDKARQQQNLLVLNKILGNSLLRYEIVDRIVD